MDYDEVRDLIEQGIEIMSDGDGWFDVRRGGGVKIVNGNEVSTPTIRFKVYGFIRDVSTRDVDGENILASDKRGTFKHDPELITGDEVFVDGEAYRIVNLRPVKPTGTVVAYRPILRRIAVAHG